MPFDHFDLVAGLYDRAGKFLISRQLAGLLSLSPQNLLLDAGGGTGRVASALRGLVRDAFVVDLSRGMLRRAANKGLATVCAPAEALPFPSGSFDRIIMVDALHHVFNQSQTVHEIFRVLAPAGRLVIIEPDIHKFLVKIIAICEKALLMRSHFLPGEAIGALFNGLEAKTSLVYEGNNVVCIVERVRIM